MKMRRIVQLLTLTFFVIIVLTIGSKWSSSPLLPTTTINDNYQQVTVNINPVLINRFVPQNQDLNLNNNNRMMEKLINGQPNLAKYVHLDLKGAPPQANRFYESFFNFLNKLQMGVKGILIEYEDMLPLQGRFTNVSRSKIYNINKKQNKTNVWFLFRQLIDLVIRNLILN
jgi:hypothetical protein